MNSNTDLKQEIHYIIQSKPRHRWKDNIRMDLKEIGINTRNWVGSAQDWDCW